MVHDNSGWPESFGFSIAGDAPVVVVSVLENSIAHSYGLNVGDQILEINDKNVRGLSKEQVILVARRSKQCPPSLAVISRMRTFRLKRRRHVGFGVHLRGSRPVYVQSVAKNSPAYEAGICPGDMLIKVNGRSVKNFDKKDVSKMLEMAGNNVKLMVIAGSYAIKKFEERFSASSSSRHKKYREFFIKMNYYLTGEEHKKTLLIALLKRYARDRDIERFSRLVSSLLTSDVQRGLLKHVRFFIPARHQPYFDAIVNQNYSGGDAYTEFPKISPGSSPRDQAEVAKRIGNQLRTSPRDPFGQKMFQEIFHATSTPFNKKENAAPRSWSKGSAKPVQKASSYRSVTLKRETGSSSFGFTISGCRPVFIRSIDDDGPAVLAGLKPGDCIIELNGINVRNASHESVIELLKNSGTSPTLIVQWRPLPENLDVSPIRNRGQSDGSERRQQLQESNSLTDSALEIDLSPRNGYHENAGTGLYQEPYHADLVKHLKEQMKKLLTRGEQLVVKQCLVDFHQDRNVSKLVDSLEPVLDDPLKLQMLHCISRLLPGPAQLEFEKQAVDMVARQMENGIIISAATSDHEIFDILFRVQGSKLSETDRPRNLIGGLVDVKADSSWPSSKAVSHSNSTGSLSDLDQTPAKGRTTKSDIIELKESPIKDSTFVALMSIDENKIRHDQSQDKTVVTTAVVHKSSGQQKSSTSNRNSDKRRQSDKNNNDDVFVEEDNQVYSTNIDELMAGNGGDLTHPSQKDIDELKAELILAQEEARKARKEADEKRLVLENQGKASVAASPAGNGPTSIADAIKEKSFQMEPEKIRTASTDDHVVLPRQFPPPGMLPPPPPPPPPPAPPPPPPPPGAAGMNAMQLKRINWEKVSGVSLENTVWGKLQSEDQVDDIIDFMELEQLFSTKNKPVKEKKPEKKQTSILESKKTYNLSILLGHLKMPIDELHKAVLSIDETKLTEPHIRTLLMCAPEGNEVEAYKNFSDDSKTMSNADAFSSKMLSISNYTERLRAMLFKARFHDRVSEIQPDIESVSLASDEVKSSKKLMKILEIVLATGNYMNKGSSTMSGASGFKISFLTKLINTKTSDNKSTLLHVIVNTIKNNKSELLDVKDELPHVPLAAKVSSQMLTLEISELRTGMKEINDELKNYAVKEGDNDDRYKEVIGKFVKDAQKQFDDLLESYNKMKTSFSSTTEFYSEKQITTEDFFGAFAIFLQHLESVKKDVMSEEEKREYQARKERELEEIRKRKGSTTSRSRSVSSASQPSIGEEELKDALRKRSASQESREIPSIGAVESADRALDSPVLQKFERKVEVVDEVKETRNSVRSLSVNSDVTYERSSDNKDPEETNAAKQESNEVKQTTIKRSPDAVRVLPQNEPNAFAMLLKRRERIEDTDSERERADSSASDASVFSTLPRARFKPPPALPKKKKPAPPPLKPKPRQGSVDFKSMTLPRSLSKASDSEASRDSSSGGSSKNFSRGNIFERTSSVSSTGSIKNGISREREKSKINVETESAVLVNSRKREDSTSVSDKASFSQQNGLVKRKEIAVVKTEETVSSAVEVGTKSSTKTEEGVEKKLSPKTEPLVINLGPNLPTYSVDVMYNESEFEKRKTSISKKPTKPARKNIDFTQITPYQPKGIEIARPDHDPDDYDNLPSDKSGPSVLHEDLEEPDYALPTFAVDQRNGKPDSFADKNSTTSSDAESRKAEVIEEKLTETIANVDSAERNHYSELKSAKGSQYSEANFDREEAPKKQESLTGNSLESTNRDNDSDSESSYGDQYSLESKHNAFNRGNLLRHSSLSSSQSSESESPQSYRKFKQNRSTTPKTKSSTLQKIKGVISGMRSRSSSDASTTSVEPASDADRRKNNLLKMSPKPILKKFTKSRDNSPESGRLSRSHSPHTVTFQDIPSENQEVVKLSTDDESLPEMSFKIPPMPKSAPPLPPPDSVPPPMPPPYHLRKDSTTTSEPQDAKRVVSTLNIEITSPTPPSFKPPPPPKSQKPTPPEDSPLSPTPPQFKPPPPPFLAKMKAAPTGLGKRTPPPPPVEPPPSGKDASTTPTDIVHNEAMQNGTSSSNITPAKKVPPPPPKRIESIKASTTTPERSVSPPSSASLVRKTLSSAINQRKPEEKQLKSSEESSVVTCNIDAEFDTWEDQEGSTAQNKKILNSQSESRSLENPTPPPHTPTVPLDDIPIVPPPPSPSPPKTQYVSSITGGKDQENEVTVSEETNSNKPDVLPKSMFMVKVLPKTPPLLFRENETDQENSPPPSPSSPTTHQSHDWHSRANRADSVSSVGSMSFPPLPPESLLETVEEDYSQYHTVFQF